MNLEDVIQRGTRAAQPAANTVPEATIYYVTDEAVTERSNGSAWQDMSDVGGGINQLTGDVTAGPGSGSEVATIPNNTITDAKLRDSAALSVIGRSANSSGDPADIAAGTDANVLRRSGTSLGFGTVDLSSANAVANLLRAQSGREPEFRATLTAPVNGDFSWVNQGSSAVTDDTDSIVLRAAAVASANNLVCRVKTVPSAPYTLTVYLLPMFIRKPFLSYGICLRDSAGGGIVVFDVIAGATNVPLDIRVSKYNSATSFNSSYTTLQTMAPVRWLRIQDDNTNRICSISMDGSNFIQLHTVGRTDFITPNQIGFHMNNGNNAVPNLDSLLRVCSWLQA